MTNAEPSSAALKISHVSKSFGGVTAINDVSFDVRSHNITALIGPNGAGKTTLFNLITNIYPRDTGTILFMDEDLAGIAPVRIAQRGLIRTFQAARVFPGMTVLENAMIGAHRHAKQHGASQMAWLGHARREEEVIRTRADALLKIAGLAVYRDAHAADLPMGAQKTLEVIRALMAQPTLLCLDEPAAGLNDTETQDLANLLRAVRSIGISVLVVEHNMSLVMNVADNVVVIDAGSVIAQGTPNFIQTHPAVIEAYLGRQANAAS